jgi:Ca2+-binding RTX toxin-like protein
MVGDEGVDTLVGNGGNDTLFEATDFAASDPLDADTFSGGAGTDLVAYTSSSAGVTVTIDDVADDGSPGEGDNVRGDVENVSGSNASDELTGNGVANLLNGSGGDDALQGGAGNDRLFGGTGFDALAGGTGIDECDVEIGGGTETDCEV